jgi:hypothetical protein
MTIDTSRESLPKLIAVEEFFAEPEFAVPMISPDGTRIAYLAPHLGRRNIWVRGVDQTHDDAVPVTSDARRGITTYFWTDDPRWLLYLQDTDGNEDWHLHRVDLDAPAESAVDLTPMGTGSRVLAVEPLPSAPGSVLAWMNRRTTHIDIFRIDIATGETVLHHEQADDLANVLLDRGGEPAFQVLTEQDGTIVVSGIDRETGALRLLKRMGGAEYPLGVQPQVVTPDGDGLLVGAFSGGDELGASEACRWSTCSPRTRDTVSRTRRTGCGSTGPSNATSPSIWAAALPMGSCERTCNSMWGSWTRF